MNTSTDVLSLEHREALRIVIAALDATGVWYRATGGLAGNIHGSMWPLHDIDLDYRCAEWPLIAAALSRYLVEEPHVHTDDEFKLVMASARIGAVTVELCQIEDAYLAGPTGWQRQDTDAGRRALHHWQGMAIWALPLDDLIAYKALIGRSADLAELRGLALRTGHIDA